MMKLKDSFLTQDMGGTQIMVSTDTKLFRGIVRSNTTAAFIVEALKHPTTEREIVEAMTREYDAPAEVIAADVNAVLETLRGIHALDE